MQVTSKQLQAESLELILYAESNGVGTRLGASTGQKYKSTSTSTWKNNEYKYKYWIFKSTWIQVQVLWKVLEYKYRVLSL